MLKKIILIVNLILFAVNSFSGEVKTVSMDLKNGEKYKFANFSGSIVTGDARRLAEYIKSNVDWIEAINFDSNGGDLNEAVKMGEIIRLARLETVVQPGKICASACFFVWINGTDRVMFHTPPPNKLTGKVNPSKMGLHRPYLVEISNNENSLSAQINAMKMADRYLSDRQVPKYIIDLMMSRSSRDIYWLTPEDTLNIGITPPELEELYISHCSDNRMKIYDQIALARLNENKNLESILNENLSQINSCISKINFSARLRAVANGFKSTQK